MKTDDELIDGIIERFRPKEEPDDLAMFWWTEVKIMAREILRLQRAHEASREHQREIDVRLYTEPGIYTKVAEEMRKERLDEEAREVSDDNQ